MFDPYNPPNNALDSTIPGMGYRPLWASSIPTDQRYADFTGYGPTSLGNAPIPTEVRKSAAQRYHGNRVAEAMQYIDPYVGAAGAQAMRIVGDQNRQASADELRRQLYGSAPGQAALDAAMVARRTGYLGYGDPVNYASNITSGIAAGGFSVSMLDSRGRVSATNQRVSGTGILSERVALNVAGGMLRDLYGSGTPDPSKLYGFNMEEASEVFRMQARRGGLGNIGSLKQDASLSERLAAARMAAVGEHMRTGIAGLDVNRMADIEGKKSDTERARALDAYAKEINDPRVEREMRAIIQSKDAFVVSDSARSKFMDASKNMLKGMANLKDIFGELSNPELASMLESIGGKRIVGGDVAQAKRATQMVSTLRNAADAAGMDPRAFIQMTQSMQYGMAQALAQAFSSDARSAGLTKGNAAILAVGSAANAAVASGRTYEVETQAARMGIRGFEGTNRSADEIMADTAMQQGEMASKFSGYIATKGMLNVGGLGNQDAAAARSLLARFETATSARERSLIEDQLRSLVGGRKGFGAFMASATGQQALYSGMSDSDTEATRLRMSTSALNVDALRSQLEQDAGVPTDRSEAFARLLTGKLGGGGLLDMIEDSRSGKTREDRLALMRARMGIAGLSEEEFNSITGTLFDSEGRATSAAASIAGSAARADREGGSTYERSLAASRRLAQLSNQVGVRAKLAGEDKSISFKSIARAVLTKKVDNLDDTEATVAVLEAAKASGMSLNMARIGADGKIITNKNGSPVMEDLSGQFQSGIDISSGLSMDALKRIRQGSGVDFDLAAAMGMSPEELVRRTANGSEPDLMLRAYEKLTTQAGFSVGGSLGNMSIMSSTLEKNANVANLLKRQKQLAIAEGLSPGLTKNEYSAMEQSVMAGKGFGSLAEFAADTDRNLHIEGKDWTGFDDDKTKVQLGRFKKLQNAAGFINNASDAQLAEMRDSGLGATMAEQLRKEVETLSYYKGQRANTIKTFGENGVEEVKLTDQLIRGLQETIAKLEGKDNGKSVGTMTVTNLTVTGEFNGEKQ